MISRFNQLFLKYAQAVDSLGKPKAHELAHGLCYYWSHVFSCVIGGECVTIGSRSINGDLIGHMMVKYRGRFYDADHPRGMLEPVKKPADEIWIHKTPKAAQKFWQTPISEQEIHRNVIKEIQKEWD